VASVESNEQKIADLSGDVRVIKSQLTDIREAQRAMNVKLDGLSAYTRQESDNRFAFAQDVANLRWLIYTIVGGIIAFFFYIVQAKVI
jgi:hypothetical protein